MRKRKSLSTRLDEMQSAIRATATKPPPPLEYLNVVPDPLRSYADEFGASGFLHLVTEGALELVVVVLFRNQDSTYAEIVLRKGQPPFLELSSFLLARRASLATSTYIQPPRLWQGELRQTFPGDTPRELVHHHSAALEFLDQRGINADPIALPEALDVRADMVSRIRVAMLQAAESKSGRRMIAQQAWRVSRSSPTLGGLLRDQPDIDKQIKELRALAGES